VRITHLELRFLDGSQTVANYTTPGWYLLASDADADGHLWAIEPVKLSPTATVEIASAIAVTTRDNTALTGVRNQNTHATRQAAQAVERANHLAAEAARRAAELAEWNKAVTESPDPNRADP
jgi:hypothetical protein